MSTEKMDENCAPPMLIIMGIRKQQLSIHQKSNCYNNVFNLVADG